MSPLPLSDALLAHSVPAIGIEEAIIRVNAITDIEALKYAEFGETGLNGRSAVLAAIAHRYTVIRMEQTLARGEARIRELDAKKRGAA